MLDKVPNIDKYSKQNNFKEQSIYFTHKGREVRVSICHLRKIPEMSCYKYAQGNCDPSDRISPVFCRAGPLLPRRPPLPAPAHWTDQSLWLLLRRCCQDLYWTPSICNIELFLDNCLFLVLFVLFVIIIHSFKTRKIFMSMKITHLPNFI